MAKLRRISATPVSEGVRLEVGKYTVFAVRNAELDIAVRVRREPRGFLRACMTVPLLRGAARLIRDVLRFFDGLSESAELDPQRPVRGTRPEQAVARLLHIRPQTLATLLSALLMFPLAFLCLYAAPMGAQMLLRERFALSRLGLNMATAGVRVVCVFAAVGLACRLRVFKRLGMYRGAINQVVNCYESREEVTAQSVAEYPLHTRRSEPAFVLCALGVALLLFPLFRPRQFLVDALIRVGVLLLAAAVVNEPFSALEEAEPTLPVRILRAPMDLMQHMTVLAPHPQMLEVAICAFNAAMGKAREELEAGSGESDDTAAEGEDPHATDDGATPEGDESDGTAAESRESGDGDA